MPALKELLTEIQSRQVRVTPVTTRVPSPFAASLMFNYIANFMYEGDSPMAERRAQALVVDPSQLRELLGEVELRELLDPGALESLEQYLQHLVEERKAKSADALHDLLLRLGDLSVEEILARAADPAESVSWLAALEHQRRVVKMPVAGEERFIAAEARPLHGR
jgi:ATP-dependent Lhr-like helicase